MGLRALFFFMISSKNLTYSINDVPSYWVFQYYLQLSEVLTGQDVKIKSIFNSAERTPSFCVYVDKTRNQYVFKDFSTGKSGDKIDIVREMFNLSYPVAVDKIVDDYNEYKKLNKVVNVKLKKAESWKLSSFNIRKWNKLDAEYWLQYNIGKSILERYNVAPLSEYIMTKQDGVTSSIKIEGDYIYGYCDSEKSLYKIYQPLKTKYKFFFVNSDLQGLELLKYDKPYLVICSSLKDAMCLMSFGYPIEVLAPNSESTIIKPHIIDNLKKKYKKVIVFFDNDNAGKNSINKYKELYNLEGITETLSKDIADTVKEHGPKKADVNFRKLLKSVI